MWLWFLDSVYPWKASSSSEPQFPLWKASRIHGYLDSRPINDVCPSSKDDPGLMCFCDSCGRGGGNRLTPLTAEGLETQRALASCLKLPLQKKAARNPVNQTPRLACPLFTPQGLIPMLIQRRLLIKTDLRCRSPLKPHPWEPSMEVTLAVVNILSTHQWVGTALSSLPSHSSQRTCPDAWGSTVHSACKHLLGPHQV